MRHSDDFRAAVRSGRRAGRPRLVVHLAAPAADAVGRPASVGFVVSRQVGPSVVRNRVRRRLRHLMLDRLDRLPAGSRAVVRANPAAASASFADLASDLDAALRRLSAGAAR
jgi:ribonuclease P protein component